MTQYGLKAVDNNGNSLFMATNESYVFLKSVKINGSGVIVTGISTSESPPMVFSRVSSFDYNDSQNIIITNGDGEYKIQCNMPQSITSEHFIFVTSSKHNQIHPRKWGVKIFDENGRLSHASSMTPLSINRTAGYSNNSNINVGVPCACLVRIQGFFVVQSPQNNGFMTYRSMALGVGNTIRSGNQIIGRGGSPQGAIDPVVHYIDTRNYK
ncbi:TPA: hypothetical protein ACSTL2_001711 [Morganella morganii]